MRQVANRDSFLKSGDCAHDLAQRTQWRYFASYLETPSLGTGRAARKPSVVA